MLLVTVSLSKYSPFKITFYLLSATSSQAERRFLTEIWVSCSSKIFFLIFLLLADFYTVVLGSPSYSLCHFPSSPCSLFCKTQIETPLNNRVNEVGRPKDSQVLYIHILLIHLCLNELTDMVDFRVHLSPGASGGGYYDKPFSMTVSGKERLPLTSDCKTQTTPVNGVPASNERNTRNDNTCVQQLHCDKYDS